jgi:hypothetical protein
VLVSAHQRRKLQSRLRRSKSTPLSDRSREYWHDDYKNKLELVITNNSKVDEKDLKERYYYEDNILRI